MTLSQSITAWGTHADYFVMCLCITGLKYQGLLRVGLCVLPRNVGQFSSIHCIYATAKQTVSSVRERQGGKKSFFTRLQKDLQCILWGVQQGRCSYTPNRRYNDFARSPVKWAWCECLYFVAWSIRFNWKFLDYDKIYSCSSVKTEYHQKINLQNEVQWLAMQIEWHILSISLSILITAYS